MTSPLPFQNYKIVRSSWVELLSPGASNLISNQLPLIVDTTAWGTHISDTKPTKMPWAALQVTKGRNMLSSKCVCYRLHENDLFTCLHLHFELQWTK